MVAVDVVYWRWQEDTEACRRKFWTENRPIHTWASAYYITWYSTVVNFVSDSLQLVRHSGPLPSTIKSAYKLWPQQSLRFVMPYGSDCLQSTWVSHRVRMTGDLLPQTMHEQRWNFPHCIGALDGKHVVMKAPSKTGSLYFNYKGTFSMVLLALVDASYKFIYIDIGSYGRNSDGGVFSHSNLGKALCEGQLKLPQDRPIEGAEDLGPLPYVIVGDEAFPPAETFDEAFSRQRVPTGWTGFQLQAFSSSQGSGERVWHSGRSLEGVQLYRIAVRPDLVRAMVKASCCLHNMLQDVTTPAEVVTLLQDEQGRDRPEGLEDLQATGNRASREATTVRNKFKDYFVNYCPLTWQNAHINHGRFT